MCYLTFLGVFEASLWYQPHPSCLCAGQRGEAIAVGRAGGKVSKFHSQMLCCPQQLNNLLHS